MRYEGTVYRPPGEWKSYLLQVTVGCSHNACTFCGMYKGKKYRVRPMEDIIGDIREAAAFYNQYEKVFLCDGDAIAMDTEDLLEIIAEIKKDFPHCRLISTYAGPKSTLKKTPEELKRLHEAGLGRAYLGIETGMEEILKSTNKGSTGHRCWRLAFACEMQGSIYGALFSSVWAVRSCPQRMPGRRQRSSMR